ncbi:MAG: DUF4115 domain-containing protein [Acidobacteriota bacterium]
MTHRTLFPPPDENRALEQLERLHREILRARRDRERAGAEFDGFVQEFRDRPQESAPAVPERASHRVPRPVVPPSVPPGPPVTVPSAPQVSEKASPAPADEVIPALAASPRAAGRGLLAVALVLLVGAAAAFYFWQRSQGTAPAAPAPQATASPAAPGPTVPRTRATAAGPSQPSAAAVPPVSPSTVQLMTDRPVWMRVIVDGQKILERVVPAGEHLIYTPTRFISVRAGDAGGVRVKVGSGPEQVLGRNAFPLTRRFDVPGKP